MSDIKFEIIEEIGSLLTSSKGWNKELNKISWNNGVPKFDIRDWSPEDEKMGKRVTLTKEARQLYDLLGRALEPRFE